MLMVPPQNKHVTREKGNKCGKVGNYECTRWVIMVGELRGGDGRGAKVMTWHMQ